MFYNVFRPLLPSSGDTAVYRTLHVANFDVLLTVYLSIILVTDQLNAQILVLYKFIISSTCFEQYRCCTGWERTSPLPTCAADSHLQSVMILYAV